MLRVFNNTARYVDQGGNKRKGAFAVYLEPWHVDVVNFLELKRNHGAEEERARDLFYGLWIPDLFMKRVETDANWSLFCPNEAPGLQESFGEKFEALYEVVRGHARQSQARHQGSRAVLANPVEPARNRNSLHAVQGCGQSAVKYNKLGHNSLLEFVRGNHRVLVARRNRCLQLGLDRSANVRGQESRWNHEFRSRRNWLKLRELFVET